MQEINQLKLSGTISKVYKTASTPTGVKVSRFVIEHNSKQWEADAKRLVYCKIFCISLSSEASDEMLGKMVNATGFLSMNANKNLVFHVDNLQILY